MSAVPLVLKKPKAEEREEEADGEVSENGTAENISISEQEEALVALIEHRTKEVEHLRKRIDYYKSQVVYIMLMYVCMYIYSYVLCTSDWILDLVLSCRFCD